MTAAAENSATRRKRLLWRANHRGMKEMDLIMIAYQIPQILKTLKTQTDVAYFKPTLSF